MMDLVNVNAIRKIVIRDWEQALYTYYPYRKSHWFWGGGEEEGYYDMWRFIIPEGPPDFKVGDEYLPDHLVEDNYKIWIKPHYCIIHGGNEEEYYYRDSYEEAETEAYKFVEKHNLIFFIIE